MRLPRLLGCSPSPASITPAFTSSSLNAPIAVRRASLGIAPASLLGVAFTITMTFIVSSFRSPFYRRFGAATREGARDRHVERSFSAGPSIPS
jgi:hypothetical protein